MRYHYEKSNMPRTSFGKLYICNHPVYSRCTLFTIGNKGLAVIQQRHNPKTKTTWWTEIDQCLDHELYLHPNFKAYFDERAGEPVNNLY
ncbi:MAG: hypothetical protein LIO96_11800, partial [Lachnospiraceae bacterium]|nr:hypothetical protein [Lachnospiraceae bacterium]